MNTGIEKIKSHDFDATKIPQTGLEFDESRFDAVSFIVKIFQGLIDEGRGTVNRERSLSRNKEEEELFFPKFHSSSFLATIISP